MPSCDVVIVNYNAGSFLKQAVGTALACSRVARTYLIDNASSDESVDSLDFGEDERLVLIRNHRNLGFASAANIGLAYTTADYVMLLNPDCRIIPGAVERLIDVLGSSANAGMTGPLLLNPDGSEQAGGRRRIPTPKLAISRALGLAALGRFIPGAFDDFLLHQKPLPNDTIEAEAISGACMMVRRTALTDVGPLDEEYFLHCEDLDWCMRFHQSGWKILFTPQAIVIHEKGVCGRNRPFAVEWHKHTGMIRFYRKFFRDNQSAWAMPIIICGVWLRFAAISGYLFITQNTLR